MSPHRGMGKVPGTARNARGVVDAVTAAWIVALAAWVGALVMEWRG